MEIPKKQEGSECIKLKGLAKTLENDPEIKIIKRKINNLNNIITLGATIHPFVSALPMLNLLVAPEYLAYYIAISVSYFIGGTIAGSVLNDKIYSKKIRELDLEIGKIMRSKVSDDALWKNLENICYRPHGSYSGDIDIWITNYTL